MRIEVGGSSRGASIGSTTMVCALHAAIVARPMMNKAAVVQAAVALIKADLVSATAALDAPESPAGRRLRQDLAEELAWIARAGHVREDVEAGESRYRPR